MGKRKASPPRQPRPMKKGGDWRRPPKPGKGGAARRAEILYI
jgi:hypothetical protein